MFGLSDLLQEMDVSAEGVYQEGNDGLVFDQSAFDGVSRNLVTVRDFIRWCACRFEGAGLFFGHGSDNAFDEAMHLVYQSLGLPWDIPESYLDCRLTEAEKERIIDLAIQRIADRKPLAYLLNEAWFCGMSFYVDERVLIPRSPVAELISNGFFPWLDGVSVVQAMDLCCGSGCIGIALAHRFDQAEIDLIDISSDALEVAGMNIDRYDLWGRVQIRHSDLFSCYEQQGGNRPRCQLIVANPPYVDEEDMADRPKEFTHEPTLGLAAGVDGLLFASRILASAAEYLDEQGWLVLEIGNSQWALRERYSEVPFVWPAFARGGHGVALLSSEHCRQYQSLFQQRVPHRGQGGSSGEE